MLSFMLFSTHLGWMGIVSSERGIRNIILPRISKDIVLQQIGNRYDLNQLDETPRLFGDVSQRLQQYLNGKRIEFHDNVDISGATPFQQTIWNITRTIPYGEIRSYSWIAVRSGSNAARAAGQALKRNPIPILIPCHRVIRNNADPGGFSGGIELKKYLLEMEAKHL